MGGLACPSRGPFRAGPAVNARRFGKARSSPRSALLNVLGSKQGAVRWRTARPCWKPRAGGSAPPMETPISIEPGSGSVALEPGGAGLRLGCLGARWRVGDPGLKVQA